MLGVLLVAVGDHVPRVARTPDERWPAVGMATPAITTNGGIAFVVGVSVHRGYN